MMDLKNKINYEPIDVNDEDFCQCGLCTFMKKYISPIFEVLIYFIYKIKNKIKNK
jgi:hypothetical protein